MKNIVMALVCTMCVLGMNAQKVTIDLKENFDELKVYDRLNVNVIESDKNQVVISGDDTDEVSAVVKDGTLKLRMELDNFMDGNKTVVNVYYKNTIVLIDVNEGAEIASTTPITSNYMTLKAQEGGRLNLPIAVKNVQVKAISGGQVTISGTASNTDIAIRTGGAYNGKKLESATCDVSVLAGGKAEVKVSGYVDANVTAGGTITI